MNILSKNLKRLRREKGLTQKELGDLLQTDQRYCSKIETNIISPSIEKLVELANIFNCTIDFLVGRESDDGTITIFNDGEHLSDVEQNLIDLFRQMSGAQQSHLVGYGMGMLMAGA